MILTDYYLYQRKEVLKENGKLKNKSRLECTASTQSYDLIDRVKTRTDNQIVMHITPFMDGIKASRHRKGMFRVTVADGNHITSIYPTDWERGYAYGDFKGTTDLMLLIFHNFSIAADGTIADGAAVEIFIARGKKFERNQVNNLFQDGELTTEMEQLRQAVTKSVTGKTE
jgi:hypothetical protein